MAVSANGPCHNPGHVGPDSADDLGEFTFSGAVSIGRIADFYAFTVPEAEKEDPLAEFVVAHLRGRPAVGKGVRLEDVELVVQDIDRGRVSRVALELDPPDEPRRTVRDPAPGRSIAR